MSDPNPVEPNDPKTWPVIDARPDYVYLGPYVHDGWADLTPEQKSWPVIDARPDYVLLSFDEMGKRIEAPRTGPGFDDRFAQFRQSLAEWLRTVPAAERESALSRLVAAVRQDAVA